MASGGANISATASIIAISPGMTEEDLVKKLREALKAYIEKELDAKTIESRNPMSTGQDLRDAQIKMIGNPTLASLIVSYLSLVHQERQDKTNTKLQWLIIFIGAISALSAVLVYFKPSP